AHNYEHPGNYEVCVKIIYFGGCEARKCKPVRVGPEDECRADFERIPVSSTNDALLSYFKALPWNSNNRKPARICWTFGDGRDTCITYPENYTGVYAVSHRYEHPGTYEVCVKILYYGGCEARKCKLIEIVRPDQCTADFERIPNTSANDQLRTYFRALPCNNNNRKPARICWTFGDGQDTCINYGQDYNGQYVVPHNYQHPGTYEVCVKILYYGGCEARKCKTIIIPPIPVTCAVGLFEITPSITSLVRGFLAVPSSAPPRRPERICWVFGDGEDTCIMIDPNGPLPDFVIRHTYPGPGIYRACVKVRFQGGCEAYDCLEVRIQGSTNICGGYMVETLTGPRTYKFKGFSIHNPNDQVIGFRWTFGDGSTGAGEEVMHTYAQGGDYNVCLTIRTQLGCETRICKTVRVPGNNAPTLVLTPNPVINTLHVQFFSTHTETVYIKIMNVNGIVVRNYIRNVTVGANNWDHDLGNLLPGIYSYTLSSPNQLASALFLKQ
ncbi:MAG TPA: PKD domain-containing protein, partial [Chitinophagaceae bacterium]|nr:PKD domain-containing protein [Chitinophagaceae bacterium]